MDETLNELMGRMNVRNLERIHSDCERDGDFELAEIVAARLGGTAAAAEPSESAS